jgi:hypothetical protein
MAGTDHHHGPGHDHHHHHHPYDRREPEFVIDEIPCPFLPNLYLENPYLYWDPCFGPTKRSAFGANHGS